MSIITQEFKAYNWHYYPEGDGNSRRGVAEKYKIFISTEIGVDGPYKLVEVPKHLILLDFMHTHLIRAQFH